MLETCIVCKKRIIKPSKKTTSLTDGNKICSSCFDSIPLNTYLQKRLKQQNQKQVMHYLQSCKKNQKFFYSNFTMIHKDIIIEFDFFRGLMRTNKFPDVIDLKYVTLTRAQLDDFRVERNYKEISGYDWNREQYRTTYMRDGVTYIGRSSFSMIVGNKKEVMFTLSFSSDYAIDPSYNKHIYSKKQFKEECIGEAQRYADIIRYNARFSEVPITETVTCETINYGEYKQYNWDKVLAFYSNKKKAMDQLNQLKNELIRK